MNTATFSEKWHTCEANMFFQYRDFNGSPKQNQRTICKSNRFPAAEYWPTPRYHNASFAYSCNTLDVRTLRRCGEKVLIQFMPHISNEEPEKLSETLMHSMALCARMTLTFICSRVDVIFTMDMEPVHV